LGNLKTGFYKDKINLYSYLYYKPCIKTGFKTPKKRESCHIPPELINLSKVVNLGWVNNFTVTIYV